MTKPHHPRGARSRLDAAAGPAHHGTPNRARIAVGAAALTLLTVLALVISATVSSDGPDDAAPPRPASTSGDSTAAVPTGHAGPPRTRDPLTYARAFTVALWSYDTRTGTHAGHVAALLGWLTGEQQYADPASVTAQVPDPVLWSRMHDGGQYATATATEAHIPASFTAAVNADPDRITTAYAYAVTVTGKQQIRWTGTGPDTAGTGAEARAVTLAVQCRPDRDCALIGVTPNVAP